MMKRWKALSLLLAFIVLLGSVSAAWPAYADETSDPKPESVELGKAGSGYRLNIPGFIDIRTVSGKDKSGEAFSVEAVKVKLPAKNGKGKYTLFEIAATDKRAHAIEAYPAIYGGGQLAGFSASFTDGKAAYEIDDAMLSAMEDEIFSFSFYVFDKDDNYIIDFYDIHIVFEGGYEERLAPQATAQPTSSKVLVNGKEIAFQAYMIGGNNYFKLRDIAKVVSGSGKQFEVKFDAGLNAINLVSNAPYTSVGGELASSADKGNKKAWLSSSRIYLNGERVKLGAYTIGNNNYFKLRDLGKAIGFAVEWDGKAQTISIDTSKPYTD